MSRVMDSVTRGVEIRTHEYLQRLEKTRAEIGRAGLDALLLHRPESILYLSGFHTIGMFSYHALLVPREGDPTLILRDMEVPAAQESSWITRTVTYSDLTEYESAIGKLSAAKEAVENARLDRSRIGIESFSGHLTLARYDALLLALPNVTFVREPRIVERLALIKSDAEVANIRSGAEVAELAMADAIAEMAPGVTERRLAEVIDTSIIRNGGVTEGADTVIVSGDRTAQLHGQFSDRSLQHGDSTWLELTGKVNHYIGRLMRTTIIGKPSREQSRTAQVLIDAQDAAFALMKPGVQSDVIDAACRQPVLDAGLRNEYTNRTGYAVGLRCGTRLEHLHEFVPGAGWILEAGMVFHMLMMARGIGISETVLVTPTGPEFLTTFDRRLLFVD